MTKRTSQTLEVDGIFHSLIELEAWLTKVHTAAKEGHLDWGRCSLRADLEFHASSHLDQSFEPLEHLISSLDAPHGLPCHTSRKASQD